MPSSDALFNAMHYLQHLQGYWWPFCRIMATCAFAPLFNHKAISIRVRVLLALALTAALGSSLPNMPDLDPLSGAGVLASLEQVIFGILLGLALQLVFTVYMVVGEIVSTQMGMSMARFNDPMNGVSSSSIIYQLYFILLVFLYFAIDAHLITVGVLYQSFTYWPVGSGLSYLSMHTLALALAWVFSAAVLIALPISFCMTMVQFCFGLLNRISPAMNLFSLGFPITILLGLLLIFLTLPNIPESYLNLSRELLRSIGLMLEDAARG